MSHSPITTFGGWAASLRLAWAVHLVGGAAKFDIIQCHFGALGLKAVLLRHIGALSGRIVTAFHGEDITNYPKRFGDNHYARLFESGDLFLPVSPRWNDALASMGCPPGRIRTHRMGIDIRLFPQRSPARSSGTLRILTIGRLVEKKGIADAILAVAGLTTNVEYEIVGDGPLRAELEALVRTQRMDDRVRFIGAQTRDQISARLQRADIFLAPSVTGRDGDIEGIPVTIMEAMATGLPVVSTKHSAIPDLVADGVSGFLVDEHDIAALTSRLSALAADSTLRAQMGAIGRDIVTKDFEMGALTTRLENHYRGLLEPGGMEPPGATASPLAG
jgi:colanic acid/amylovoran biosynthesis glycosyltransferase